MTCMYGDAPAWVWLATSPASIGEHEEDERGLRSPGNSSPALHRTPHCRALSHRGTMPELRGSRLGERNYLRKMDAAHGTRHPHTHTHSVSPRIGPRESDTFRAKNHSCLYTVLWTRKP